MGSYALTFSIFLLLSQIQQALLLEPQSVLGPAEFSRRLPEYLGALLWLYLGLAALIAAGARRTFRRRSIFWSTSSSLPRALAGVSIAAPSILLVLAGSWRLLCQAGISNGTVRFCSLLHRAGCDVLSSASHPVHVAIDGLSSHGAWSNCRQHVPALSTQAVDATRDGSFLWRVAKEHWIYGRWALASAVVTWLPWNVYYSVLGHYWGMDATGDFRAIMNFLLPLGQTLTALSLLAHPIVARKLAQRGIDSVLSQGPEIVGSVRSEPPFCIGYVVLPLRGPLFRLCTETITAMSRTCCPGSQSHLSSGLQPSRRLSYCGQSSRLLPSSWYTVRPAS